VIPSALASRPTDCTFLPDFGVYIGMKLYLGFLSIFVLAVLSGCSPSVSPQAAIVLPAEAVGNLSTVFGVDSTPINLKAAIPMEADFKWKDSVGNIHSLSELQGKIVLVNFWATWCSNCWPELPGLDSIAKIMRADSVVVIGIMCDQDLTFDQLQYQIKAYGLSYQNIADPQWEIYSKYNQINGFPQSFLIDQSGTIQFFFPGAHSQSQFVAAIKQLE
jgi:peroxiredoxin